MSDTTARSAAPSTDEIVPLRRRWRTVAAITTAIFGAVALWSVFTNERFQWGTVGQYLFAPEVLAGLGQTLLLTAVAAIIALVIGCVIALMRLSGERLMEGAANIYIWAFRSTPLLVQLLFWYNLGALYPRIGIGIPGGPQIMLGNANDLITPLTAAILGLALHEAAYTAEVFRAGILSINKGQTEAARALGLSPARTMRYIILPQALRIIIPPLGNNTIHLLKSTSLVSAISMSELLYSVQTIYSRTFETIPLLIVAVLWYMIVVSVLSVLQGYIESRLNGKSITLSRLVGGGARKTIGLRRNAREEERGAGK